MKKFITDNLRLSIKYIVEINELVRHISDFTSIGLNRKFEDYYTRILSGDSHIFYFKNGLCEWLDTQVCSTIKKSFFRELKLIIKPHEKSDLIWFPMPLKRGENITISKLHDQLSEALPLPDILSPEYLVIVRKAISDYIPEALETRAPVIAAFQSLQKLINYEITMFLFDKELELNNEQSDYSKITQFEKDCYINAWIKQAISPKEWKRFEGIIITEELVRRKVTEKIQEKVFKHQRRLFYEIASSHYRRRYLDIFNKINDQDIRIEVANTDLTLISDMIRGNLNSFKVQIIEDTLDIVEIPKIAALISKITKRNFQRIHFDIHHNENMLKAFALYEYKKYLNNYLKNTAPQPTLFDKDQIAISKPTFRYIYFDKHPDKITRLFYSLKHNNAIAPATDKKTFESIFSGYPLKQAIVWTGSIAELKTLITTLTQKENPLLNIPEKKKWAVTANCFTKFDGAVISSKSLRTAKISKKAAEFSKIASLLS